jgi:hypothetical protein
MCRPADAFILFPFVPTLVQCLFFCHFLYFYLSVSIVLLTIHCIVVVYNYQCTSGPIPAATCPHCYVCTLITQYFTR